MAETRRKSVKGFPRINNCAVDPTCFAQLNRIAGGNGMGYAIEQLCKREALVLQILESDLPAENKAKAAKEVIRVPEPPNGQHERAA